MALTLSDLLAGSTTDETLATLVALAAVAGFPAYAWQSGTVPRTFFELESLAYADMTQVIAAIASGGFVDYAEGPWLTLRAAQGYNIQRKAAVATQGLLRLSDDGGVGPVTIDPGGIIVESGGVRFRSVSTTDYPLPSTLLLSSTADVIFEAEIPGSDGNIADGADFALVTSLPGVTVAQVTPPGDTWITVQGADEESDAALCARCKDRWGELGYGATEAAYRFWAASASDEVTRVSVAEATGTGAVSVYVAGNAGAVSVGALADVQAYLDERRPQCVVPTAYNAITVQYILEGYAKVQPAQLVAAKAAALAALNDFLATVPIGGSVYRGQVESVLLNAHPGIYNVILSNPAELALPDNGIPVATVTDADFPFQTF